jgi:hypothetical protein
MTMSVSDVDFIQDCWRCLNTVEKRWGSWISPPTTQMEGAMAAALAYSRLAHHRNYYLEHDEINAGVAHIFHGVTRMCEVTPDEWDRFMERANNMKPLV